MKEGKKSDARKKKSCQMNTKKKSCKEEVLFYLHCVKRVCFKKNAY